MRKTELLAALFALASAAFAQSDAQDPPSRVARLNYLSGSVSFRPGTVDEWTAATLNYPVYNGDHLWADRGARSELHIGSTALRMDSETALAVLNLDDRMVQLGLTGGTLEITLHSLADGDTFEVDTPNAAVTLLRAGEYRFFVDGDRELTAVTVRSGDAEVTGSGRAFTLHARDSARLAGAADTFSSEVNAAAPPDDFDFWCQTRDGREEQSESVRHVSREMIGYEDLDSNGAWSEVPDYGWVWAPRVQAGWAPYRDGRWAWVDPWGWTWVDEAPWGFAPFHYGRWANYRGAWVWVPGTMVARPVYAPALVAFVGGGGAGVAWFPLGPREVYRPSYRVSEVYVRRVNVTHVNVANINVGNINVTNVTYVNRYVPGGVTAVPQSVFVNARPVRQSVIAINAGAMAQAQVVSAAPVKPERASVLGRAQASPGMAPPARFADRAVVTRTAPPRSNDHDVRAPIIRPEPVVRRQPERPVLNDGPIRPERPMRPQQQQQQQQIQDQPRREPRVQEPPAHPVDRPQPRSEERTERKQEKRGDARKEERKQQ